MKQIFVTNIFNSRKKDSEKKDCFAVFFLKEIIQTLMMIIIDL